MKEKDRLKNILNVLLEYTQKNFSGNIPISEKGDDIDAIALGVNVIGDELGHYIEELKAIQDRLNGFMDGSSLVFITLDSKMRVIDVNHSAVELLRKETKEQLVGKLLKEISPEITEERYQKYLSVLWGSKPISFVDEVKHPDFGVKFLEINVFKVNDGIGLIIHDITNKITAEARFEKLMESAPDALVIIDQTGKIELVNKQTERLFGYERTELIGKRVEILIPDRFSKKHEHHRTNYFNHPKVREMGIGMELSGKRKDGTEFPVEISLSPLETPTGQLVSAAIRDVTERMKSEKLIKKFYEDLQLKNEELKKANEELEEQAMKLKAQQEELEANNEELEEQRDLIDKNNKTLRKNQEALEEKTRELTQSSRYKSEFLANMSHELRSPLNSMLILSQDLAENTDGNLTEEQMESAKIINQSGEDLLSLINDILDFSKIEAGKMDINIQQFNVSEIAENVKNTFSAIAKAKGIELHVYLDLNIPETVKSDLQRVNQIVKNLVSNAVKFTNEGQVSVKINLSSEDKRFISVSVEDTGIGIEPAKQKMIFEAFQQGEGSTSRKYGGTGLGLSIATQLSKLLNGSISLKSETGKGSVFEFRFPLKPPVKAKEEKPSVSRAISEAVILDDRDELTDDDNILLIIENDETFVLALKKQASLKKFKTIIAVSGEEGLKLAEQYPPNAIMVNLSLANRNEVEYLKKLKSVTNPYKTPIHIITTHEKTVASLKENSKVQYLMKPAKKKDLETAFTNIALNLKKGIKRLLIVEDDPATMKSLKKLMANDGVVIREATSVNSAIEILEKEEIDCMILDLILSSQTGLEIIDYFQKKDSGKLPPVIIYTSKDLSEEEVNKMSEWAESIIIKSEKSQERLLEEASLFLHKTYSKLRNFSKQKETPFNKEDVFKGKTVLLVDDDMRNVFALSKVLSDKGLEVLKAENGVKALQVLKENPDVDIVLMDIMMPEMDGYETMKRIRGELDLKDLPIIALTAKAMKDDRDKCIKAGANDYFSKPVHMEKLLTLMRVWIK